MAGIILDAELHAIARYLVKLEGFIADEYQGVVDISSEIYQLNEQYQFVSMEHLSAFHADVSSMYQFERQRSLKSIDQVAFTKFKLDNLTGNSRIQQIKNELASEIRAARA
ncbi:TPA: hypothetical protein ACGSU0_004798 [Vibrio parahaemolyticus]|uniref:hypothetical protein n=1 Tax=Vibrio harveyi group TaxID=717610 RepID=UPI0004186086|nr:hypothetical protein [Vibrio parahaemolyticus]MDG2599470.1 hypothetical protein [Vibrio parahaemolyticus]